MAGIFGIYRLADMIWESEEERFEAWVVQVATELTGQPPEAYVEYTTLNTEGFELRDDQGEFRFLPGEAHKFLTRATHAHAFLHRAKISIRKVTVHENSTKSIIRAMIVAYWTAPDEVNLPFGSAPLVVDISAVKKGQSYRARMIRLVPMGETVQMMQRDPWSFRRD